MNKKTGLTLIEILISFGIVGIVIVGGIFAVNIYISSQITDYESCTETRGSIVMESYPEKCRARNGETFTRVLSDEELDRLNPAVPTSADNAPTGSIHNLPVPEAVSAVRMKVATKLGISEGVVIVMSAYEEVWPNSCLGLEGPDEECGQILVDGYKVTVQVQGKEFVYRTNGNGSVIRQER